MRINMDQATEQSVWWGRFRGVAWEVKCTDRDFPPFKEAWTFYLNLAREQFDEETWARVCPRPKRRKNYNGTRIDADYQYSYLPIISDLEWHGGITYYERRFDQFGKVSGLKAGCDFQHAWDYGPFSITGVLFEVEACINSLYDRYPDLRVHCSCVGGFHAQTDGEWSIHGEFISTKGQDWRESQGWSRMPEPKKEALDA